MNTVIFKSANRIVKASAEIDQNARGNWLFTDEFHSFEYLARNARLEDASNLATKEYCRQKSSKFARLEVTMH